jgi:hypothetical protein
LLHEVLIQKSNGMQLMYRFMKAVVANHFSVMACCAAFAVLWNILLRCQPVDAISPGVLVWWTALCAISVFNIWLWRRSAEVLASRRYDAHPAVYLFQRRQLFLSAVYVLGCAFRAILPRADVQRIGLFDSWASSVMAGRSVATVAELCFAAQWALLLYHTAQHANSRFGVVVSKLLVPLIVAAEICSWYGVLTTAYIGNAIEESIWALSASLLVVSFLALWPRSSVASRPFLATVILLGAGYVAFMCTVDVPMYVTRWLTDEANGRQYLSLSQGLWDVGSRWIVTHQWDQWHSEIAWMTLYFSVGVWCSLALIHHPRFEPNRSASA